MKAYKIRNKEGLFSKGGTRPVFSKIGKTWSSIGHLKSHLTLYASEGRYNNKPIPDDWEVIELTYTQSSEIITLAKDLIK